MRLGLGIRLGPMSGGAAAAPSYTGLIATRGLMMTGTAAHPQSMTRISHIATDSITSMQVVFQGWSANSSGETVLGETSTWECAIEYPEGVYTRVKFGGADIGSCASGSNLFSDACAVTIPSGAEFWTRTFQSNPTKILLRNIDNSASIASKNAYRFGTGVSNVVMGGALSGGTQQDFFTSGPFALIGTTNKASIIILGDSICAAAGYDSTMDAASGEMGAVRPSLNDIAYCDMSVTSLSAAGHLAAATTRRRAIVPYVSHILNNLGINDGAGSGTLTTQQQVKADWGKPMVFSTITPYTTGSFDTEAGQTAPVVGNINLYNDTVRAKPAWVYDYIEVANVVENTPNGGKWKPFYTADGIHPTTLAYDALKASGVYTKSKFVYPVTP